MKRILFLFLLTASAWAIDNSLPYPNNGQVGASGSTCVFGQNVVSGNTLIAASHWESSSTITSVTDTRSTSYSQASFNDDPNVKTAVYVGAAGGSGSNTVTFSVSGASFQQTVCLEVPSATTTVDISGTGAFSGTPATVTTTSVTTTVGQDFMFCFIGGFRNAGVFGVTAPTLAAGFRAGLDSEMGAWKLTGSNGSYSCAFTNSTNDVGSYVVIALKPSASFAVATTALPDAAAGSFYTSTLLGKGGTGSYTCAKTSGTFPVGLSLSGCTISGTPTAGAADSSLTFDLTDGSSNTASSGTLNLHLGNSLQTLTLLQSASDTGTGSHAFSSNVTSGSCIVVSGSGEFALLSPRDTLGTVFRPLASTYMSASGPNLMEVWAGKAPSGGADTVTTSAATHVYSIKEYGNCQGDFYDFADVTTGTNTGAVTITSGTSTTLVPNAMVDATASTFTGSITLSASSPLTQASQVSNGNGTITDGYHSVSSPGSDTESFSKASTADGRWGIILIGLRPSVTGTAPTAGGPRHRAQVY